jgi:hypothetical protein
VQALPAMIVQIKQQAAARSTLLGFSTCTHSAHVCSSCIKHLLYSISHLPHPYMHIPPTSLCIGVSQCLRL